MGLQIYFPKQGQDGAQLRVCKICNCKLCVIQHDNPPSTSPQIHKMTSGYFRFLVHLSQNVRDTGRWVIHSGCQKIIYYYYTDIQVWANLIKHINTVLPKCKVMCA